MGIIPADWDRVNTILRWWENPCDAPWALYIELAGPALGEAVLVLLSFGLDDIARGYLRPKGLRRGLHGGRKRGRGGRFRGIPELGEMIGKQIPGGEILRDRRVGTTQAALWLTDGVIQRGLFWWMVADVALDFGAHWLSAVQESEVCRTQRVGAAAFEDTNIFIAPAGWTSVSAVSKLYSTGTVSLVGTDPFFVGAFVWLTGDCTVTVASKIVPGPHTTPGSILQQRIVDAGGHVIWQGETEQGTALAEPGVIMPPTRLKGGGEAIAQVRVMPSGSVQAETLGVAVQTIQDL